MSDPIIAVDRVSKQVSDATGVLTILHEISFTLAPRESAAIVGASGSGKSTLLSLIAGLDVPTSGSVRLAGQDLFSLSEDERAAVRARTLGFVFQSFQLLGNLTALENVMLPLELLGARDARRQATEMLQRVGLGERLGHYPRVLSGGEQQRVALARAFVVRPAVLLADEPTGSLDFATGAAVMALMLSLNRELGTTLVLGVFRSGGLLLGHIGDSRGYRLRAGVLQQVTKDHSLLQEQIDAGMLTPEQAQFAANKNLVTRALGVEDMAQLETHQHEIQSGDIYLMCSDGLSDMLRDHQIAEVMAQHQTLPEMGAALVAAANEAGGRDNIAVVLVRAQGVADPAPRSWWPFRRFAGLG